MQETTRTITMWYFQAHNDKFGVSSIWKFQEILYIIVILLKLIFNYSGAGDLLSKKTYKFKRFMALSKKNKINNCHQYLMKIEPIQHSRYFHSYLKSVFFSQCIIIS